MSASARVSRLLATHWRRGRRPKAGKQRIQDLARTSEWGWKHNIVGVSLAPKQVNGAPTTTQALTVYVRRKVAKRRLRSSELIPDRVSFRSLRSSFVTDVVELGSVPQGHAMVRPPQPGIDVGHCRGGPGTLGFIVHNSAGRRCILSCSHVLARCGVGVDKDNQIEQPWKDDGTAAGVIATLTGEYTTIDTSGPNSEDAALAELEVDADPRPFGGGLPVTDISPGEAEDLETGTPTELRGAASGIQQGEILGSSGTWMIDMPFVGIVSFVELVAYSTFCASGDSGGAVVKSGTGTALGMHLAGVPEKMLGIFAPVAPVFKRYGLTLVVP